MYECVWSYTAFAMRSVKLRALARASHVLAAVGTEAARAPRRSFVDRSIDVAVTTTTTTTWD